MSGDLQPQRLCSKCLCASPSNDDLPPAAHYYPWHIKDRKTLHAYVSSLGSETHEWLLALFVDEELNLLAVDCLGKGDVGSVSLSFSLIFRRAFALQAAGFILAHNHPSGDPTPSNSDIKLTARLFHVAKALDVPLLDHVVVAGGKMESVGYW